MPRILVAVAFVALVAATPARAVTAAGPPQPTPGDDASMCFAFDPAGLVTGVATATGLVRTAPVGLGLVGEARRLSAPSTLVADVKPLLSTAGYGDVCVGGVGLPVVAGTVVFTFAVHTATDSYAAVFVCTYTPVRPACI